MHHQLRSKLPNIGTTIFTVMSKMAEQYDAINLSQGFPNFDCPRALKEKVIHYMNEGHNQYAPMAGVDSLRQAIAYKAHRLYDRKVCPDTEVTVSTGATEALFVAISAIVRQGDEVIVFDPVYDSYEPAITLSGGQTVHIPLSYPQYQYDWQYVGDQITAKTRLIIINSPHNPTGTILSENDLAQLAELIRGKDIFIIADEVYEHIIFDDMKHHSMLVCDELAERSFVISSFGKTYHVTGWKVGYCIAPLKLTEEFRKIHQYVNFDTCTPVQLGLADFMCDEPEHYLRLPEFYQMRRDRFCELLKSSRFQLRPTAGTYFQLLDYSGITNMDDVAYANHLTKECGIAGIPISVFRQQQETKEKVLRFCFAKDMETLEKAAYKLCEI